MTQPPVQAVVLGCSAGGLAALQSLLPRLRSNLAIPLILVSHTGAGDVSLLCELLSSCVSMPVIEARERTAAAPGTLHVAPAGYHLLVEYDRRFALSVDEKICYSRPSIDVLFETAARVYRDRLASVIMTGANSDGSAGARAVRAFGGTCIVQDPKEAEVAAMPQSVIDQAGADHVLPLAGIADLLNRIIDS